MSETVCHDCGATEGSFSRRDGGPWYCARCHWFHEAMKADGLRAALAQSLDVNADWDRYFRELAPVLDAARTHVALIQERDDARDVATLKETSWYTRDEEAVDALRAALAALPVPPVERGRAVLQTNGRSLAWPGEGE